MPITKIKDPIDRWLLALGYFVSMFSHTEATLQTVVWRLASVPTPTAQAVFSGVRIAGAIDLIRRIADAQKWRKARRAKIEPVLTQLAYINKLRNDILHYGATFYRPDDMDTWIVTNELFAHTPQKIFQRKITAEIVTHAGYDLADIEYRLILFAWGRQIRGENRRPYTGALKRAWRYIPPQPVPRSRKNRKIRRKHQRPPNA